MTTERNNRGLNYEVLIKTYDSAEKKPVTKKKVEENFFR